MKKAILLFAVILCMASCKTKYVTVPEYHNIYVHNTDTIFKADSILLHDSIYELDSVFMRMLGDTIYVDRWHERYVEHVRDASTTGKEVKTDTICKTDSVPYPVEVKVEKEVEKELSWWQKTLMYLGGLSLVLVGLLIYKKVKP